MDENPLWWWISTDDGGVSRSPDLNGKCVCQQGLPAAKLIVGIKESQVLQKSVIWKMLQTFNRFVIRAQDNENLCPSPFFSNQCSVCVCFNLIEKFSIQNLKTDGDFLQP